MIKPQIFVLFALFPMMIGPTASASTDENGQIYLRLCGGGNITIPLAGQGDDTPQQPTHSMTGGCHGIMRFGEIDDPLDDDEGEA